MCRRCHLSRYCIIIMDFRENKMAGTGAIGLYAQAHCQSTHSNVWLVVLQAKPMLEG